MADWEYIYNGVTLGGLTSPYQIQSVVGLEPPNVRQDVVSLPGSHGSYVWAQYSDVRVVTISGDVAKDATDNLEALMDAWRLAFAPQAVPLPLVFQHHNSIPRQVLCVPTKTAYTIDPLYSIGYCVWSVELTSGDPRIYDNSQSSFSILPGAAAVAGVDFSVDFSISFGGGASGEIAVVNAGTIGTFPVCRIQGPVTNPKILNENTGEYIQVFIGLGSSDILDIDFGARTITLNLTASRYSLLDPHSTWWSLAPGSTTVQFIGSGTTVQTAVSFLYRSAWL